MDALRREARGSGSNARPFEYERSMLDNTRATKLPHRSSGGDSSEFAILAARSRLRRV
jgi:hypothetical protein